MTEQCNRCRFWKEEMEHRDPNDADWGFGWCRRNPPTLIDPLVSALMPRPEYGQQTDPDVEPVRMTSASLFPASFATGWCGEFEDKSPGWNV